MAKRRHKPNGRSDEGARRFLQLDYWVLETPAARNLSGNAFKVLIYMFKRYDGRNNGQVSFGVRSGCFVRQAGTAEQRDTRIGMSRNAVSRALAELEARGFIVCTQEATFDQKRLTRNWRLTWLPTIENGVTVPPTKPFALVVDIQNPVPPEGLCRPLQSRQRDSLVPKSTPKRRYSPSSVTMGEFHSPSSVTHLITISSDSDAHPFLRPRMTVLDTSGTFH